ncbi:MAG TPA: hypothetical protein P5270_01285 [Victivallales bacterium]|nr:hypothetical protein [Victivallales bacterium]HPO89792.1 hypothetical protein [Victivallales bacterium]HRR27973.1 hypothetical protein [Victivallales bacterium]
MKKTHQIIAGIFLIYQLFLHAEDQLTSKAITHEKALSEISSRLKDINSKQEESCVFEQNEMKTVKENVKIVDEVKDENIKKIIETLNDNNSDEMQKHKIAENEYEKAAKKLEKVVINSENVKKNLDANDLLQRQKELLEETKKAEEDSSKKGNKTDFEDLNKTAELAEKQEELKKDAENIVSEESKKKMEEAAKALQNLDKKEAIKKQEEAVKFLENDIAKNEENKQIEDIERAEKLQKMNEELKEISDQLNDSINNKEELDNGERQQIAEKLDNIAQEVKHDENISSAQENLNKAIENTMEKKDLQAYSEVRKAMEKLERAAKQAQQQLAQKTNEQKTEGNRQEDSPQEQSNTAIPGKSQDTTNEWTAKLPEKERSALLAARKAKYNEKIDDIVKKYFVEIAK